MRKAQPVNQVPAQRPTTSRRGCLLLVVIVLAVAGYLWLATGTTVEPIAGTFEGETDLVLIRAEDGYQEQQLYAGYTGSVQRGDTIDTGEAGEGTFVLGGNEVFLGSGTILRIEELLRRPLLGSVEIAVALENGEVDADARHLGLGGSLSVQAGPLQIRGTQLRCVVTSDGRVSVQAFEPVSVRSSAGRVSLSGGQRLLAQSDGTWQVEGEAQPSRTPRSRSTRLPTRAPVIDLEKTLFPAADVTGTPDASATYTVREGDTLYSIARDHDIPWETLFNANRQLLDSPDMLLPGQVLQIPRP